MNCIKTLFTALAAFSAFTLLAQPPEQEKFTKPDYPAPVYFVDGFHGGLYGHYPLKTYTKYMCDLLDKYPEWSMGLEIEPETWDSVKVVTPLDYERFRKAVIAGKRVEYTNPTYAQPYTYNILGESVIRQFEYGIGRLRKHFPGITFNTYAVEEPCFTSCLPMVLSGFGFRFASIKNPNTCWGGYAAAKGGEIVRWKSKDGSSVLAVPAVLQPRFREGLQTPRGHVLPGCGLDERSLDEVRGREHAGCQICDLDAVFHAGRLRRQPRRGLRLQPGRRPGRPDVGNAGYAAHRAQRPQCRKQPPRR